MVRKRKSLSRNSRPILRKAVSRERLFERLDRFQDGPVIWVSGPGGCGKTTLVSSYLQDRGIPSLWYQVEEADKDPATFFYHLGSAFSRCLSQTKKNPAPADPGISPGHPHLCPAFFQGGLQPLETRDHTRFRQFPVHSGKFDRPGGCSPGGERNPPGHAPGADQPGSAASILDQAPGQPAIGALDLGGPAPDAWRNRWRSPGCEATGTLPRETIEHVHALADGWAAGLMLMLASLARGIDLPASGGNHPGGDPPLFWK